MCCGSAACLQSCVVGSPMGTARSCGHVMGAARSCGHVTSRPWMPFIWCYWLVDRLPKYASMNYGIRLALCVCVHAHIRSSWKTLLIPSCALLLHGFTARHGTALHSTACPASPHLAINTCIMLRQTSCHCTSQQCTNVTATCHCQQIFSVGLPCGHATCDTCWLGLLRARLSEGDAHRAACPQPGCSYLLPATAAEALLQPQVGVRPWDSVVNTDYHWLV